jgi:hypothetical protein
MTYLPSRVISAWVTIAPSGESASFAISFPVLKFHTPTQLRVAVAATFTSGETLGNVKNGAQDKYFNIFKLELVIL